MSRNNGEERIINSLTLMRSRSGAARSPRSLALRGRSWRSCIKDGFYKTLCRVLFGAYVGCTPILINLK